MINQIIKDIIKREGGFIDHPDDRGGATKYGVTAKSLAHYLGREPNTDDIKNISRDDAFEIYYLQYYKRPGIDQLPNEIQELVLDMSVNHGPKRAVKLLQKTLITNGVMIAADGLIGNKTTAAVADVERRRGFKAIINGMVDNRVEFYEKIVKHDDSQRVFLAGWVNRAESFRLESNNV